MFTAILFLAWIYVICGILIERNYTENVNEPITRNEYLSRLATWPKLIFTNK